MNGDAQGIATWPIGMVILAFLLVIAWHRTGRLSYLFCLLVFGIYLLAAIDRVFFPIIVLSPTEAEFMRDVSLRSSVNLIPFKFNFSDLPDIVFMQFVQNVLLTVPF